VLPQLVASPSVLSFGNIRGPDEYIAACATIASPNRRNFRLTSVSSDCPDLQIEAQFDSGREASEHRVKIAMRRYEGSKKGYLKGTFHVHTTEPLKRLVTIPWTAVLGSDVGPPRRSNGSLNARQRTPLKEGQQ
jgi:hypothetical protein